MFAQDIQNNKVKGNGYNFIDLFAGAGREMSQKYLKDAENIIAKIPGALPENL